MSVVPQQLLAPGYAIPRLIKGGWQLAGGHGPVDRRSAIADMMAFAEAGITAFDCADIYTGVEELIGEFLRAWRERHGPNAPPVRVHTKCVPDRDLLPVLTFAHIEALIDRSLRRLGVDTLDLVQFHWWDYAAPRWLEAAGHLATLQRAGKIRHIGLTNFDTAHVQAIVESGVPVVSHQVQASLLDRRALRDMAAYCRAHQIGLLAYGALAGGFFHERWHGVPAPAEPLENRSLVKYRLIIEEFGGWHAFQQLLDCLTEVAVAHDTTVGAVAMRMMLDEPDITAVIVGARHAAHLASTCAALALTLNDDQRRAILALVHAAPGPGGDVYTLERDPTGPHAGISRYTLTTASAP
ncbi:MAG: aldo/keto reductase [Gemmatimonas sp.]|uniref:aldo/keto reductase n=1 Tax=Gemmatimonas sp. TaxID=1962908 RepID=UPI00391F62C1